MRVQQSQVFDNISITIRLISNLVFMSLHSMNDSLTFFQENNIVHTIVFKQSCWIIPNRQRYEVEKPCHYVMFSILYDTTVN